MGKRDIPARTVFKCDACGNEAELASGLRPHGWSKLVLYRDALDFQGTPVADGTIRRDLCDDCTIQTVNAINSVKYCTEDHSDEQVR